MDEDKKFAVIKFKEEDGKESVEAVPTIWIINDFPAEKEEIQVFWPPKTMLFAKALNAKPHQIGSDWQIFNGVLLKYCRTYLNARNKARRGEETSNIESDQDSTRIRKKNPRYESTDDESSYSFKWKIAPPPPVKKPLAEKTQQVVVNQKEKNDIDKSILQNAKEKVKKKTENTAEGRRKLLLGRLTKSKTSKESPKENKIAEDNYSYDDAIKKQLFQPLLVMDENAPNDMRYVIKLLKEVSSKIDVVLMNQSAINRKLFSEQERVLRPSGLPCLPLSSCEELQAFEDFLKNSINFTVTVDYLSSWVMIGNEAKAVHILMPKLITNSLAAGYNYYGRAPKKSFRELRINEVILGAILMKNKDSCLLEAESAIKEWLKHAPQRKSDRESEKSSNINKPAPSKQIPNSANSEVILKQKPFFRGFYSYIFTTCHTVILML